MHTASSRIWPRDIEYISHDDKHYDQSFSTKKKKKKKKKKKTESNVASVLVLMFTRTRLDIFCFVGSRRKSTTHLRKTAGLLSFHYQCFPKERWGPIHFSISVIVGIAWTEWKKMHRTAFENSALDWKFTFETFFWASITAKLSVLESRIVIVLDWLLYQGKRVLTALLFNS